MYKWAQPLILIFIWFNLNIYYAIPVRSTCDWGSVAESISVNNSWKYSLTAARTALWATKDWPPPVFSVISQKSPASRWLLSLLKT